MPAAGWRVRVRIFALVALNVALALAATLTVVWLSGRPGLKRRVDLTQARSNTIDEQISDLLDGLDGEVELDAFLRPFDPPLVEVGGELQERLFGELMLTQEYAPQKVRFTHHPYAPPGRGGTELLATMQEYGVRGSFNTVVVGYRAPDEERPRRTVLNLLGEVAEVDLGNPFGHAGNFRPPSLVAYKGQEALLKALLKVTQGERPLAVFAQGHGERLLLETDDRHMGRLHSALIDDGFRVETWDPVEDGRLPEDTAVLVLAGAEEPYSPEALGWMAEYVRGGGSVIAAPGLQLPGGVGSVADLLVHFGVLVRPGIVCQPFVGADGLPAFGTPQVAGLVVRSDQMARHPILDPLRKGDRRVRLVFARPLDRGRPPQGGVLQDLMRSSEYTWEEFPEADGTFLWDWDEEREPSGPFSLAMTSVFPPSEVGPPPPPGTNPERPECRVLALGTPEVFSSALFDVNRDFLLNAFNWAASREFRATITPRTREERRLDLGADRSLFYVHLVTVWGLPGLCLFVGLLMFLRRRS